MHTPLRLLISVCAQETEDFGMLHLFIKILLQAVMERSFRERELASLLLVNLVPVPISHEQVRRCGVSSLCASAASVLVHQGCVCASVRRRFAAHALASRPLLSSPLLSTAQRCAGVFVASRHAAGAACKPAGGGWLHTHAGGPG
jgi:hypothetical protein